MYMVTLIGLGNNRYRQLKENLAKAIEAIPFTVGFREINDIDHILQYQLASIPAVLVNDGIIFDNGRVLNVQELKDAIWNQINQQFSSMKKIIIPTDLSEASKRAYLFAQQMSAETESELKLIQFIHPVVDPNVLYVTDIEYLQEAAQKEIDRFVEKNKSLGEKEVDLLITSEAKVGFAAEGIVELSDQEGVDMVIMGTTGTGGWTKKWFGSVSTKVAKEAYCPVLFIPPNAIFKGFNNILFTNSQSQTDEVTQLVMQKLCEKFNAYAHIVHIEESAQQKYSFSKKQFKIVQGEKSYTESAVTAPSVVEGINSYIEEHEIDLVVFMTTHRGMLEGLFHKSMTKAMLIETEIPLLVIHIDV